MWAGRRCQTESRYLARRSGFAKQAMTWAMMAPIVEIAYATPDLLLPHAKQPAATHRINGEALGRPPQENPSWNPARITVVARCCLLCHRHGLPNRSHNTRRRRGPIFMSAPDPPPDLPMRNGDPPQQTQCARAQGSRCSGFQESPRHHLRYPQGAQATVPHIPGTRGIRGLALTGAGEVGRWQKSRGTVKSEEAYRASSQLSTWMSSAAP